MQDPATRAGQVKEIDEMMKGTWKYGEFGKAHSRVVEATGKEINDVEITLWGGYLTVFGVLDDNGKKITFWSMNELDVFEWMTDEEYEEMKNYGDPADAPSSHYTIQPENLGKFLFITGAPGLGKSTTGHMLSKMAGYVYYEGDCFDQSVNPFIPPEAEEPSLATMRQKPLLGLPQERIEAAKGGMEHFMKMIEFKEYDKKMVGGYYTAMCKDIAAQRKRLGGNWIVAHAVPSRYYRDWIRAELGPDLVFVVLNMTREDQKARLAARHGEDAKGFNDLLGSMFDLYEPATEEEENAIDLVVTDQMTREDVAEKLLKILE